MRNGSHHREESKAALRMQAVGKKHDPATLQKIRQAVIGRTHGPETRWKMSETRRRGMKIVFVPHLWFAVDPVTRRLRMQRLPDQPLRVYVKPQDGSR
jgi:hypothetical protein